jgi:hypothetical protein
VWLVFIGTKLTHIEVASLEEVGFCFLRYAQVEARGGNPNVDDIPISKCDNKIVHHVPPRKDHDSKQLSRKNLITTILRLKDVPNLGHGRVYSLDSHDGVKVVTYEVTIGVIPNLHLS